MPKSGEYDNTYKQQLLEIGIEITGEFQGAKKHHTLKCIECSTQWMATPISKLQNYKKHGYSGCPKCIKQKQHFQKHQDNIRKISKEFDILSPYKGEQLTTIKIKVRNKKCQHEFEVAPGNILGRRVQCPICATKYRTRLLNKSSKARSEEWAKTASKWQQYKAKVASLSRKNYLKHKDKINPSNLPRGVAGQTGAYHLDHIVPVRYCFENGIPEIICAHPTNLQLIDWRTNVSQRDNLKEGVEIPTCMIDYISIPPNK